jgi:hypothetical protein
MSSVKRVFNLLNARLNHPAGGILLVTVIFLRYCSNQLVY